MIAPDAHAPLAAVQVEVTARTRRLVLRAIADTLIMEGLRYSARSVLRDGRTELTDAMELLRALAARHGSSVEALPAADALERLLAGDVDGAVGALAARDRKTASAWIADAAQRGDQ